MGNLFGSLWNDAKQTLGTAVDDGTHLVGDGLNAAGLTGAAQAVDTLGDQAGYQLGADVAELQLGQTSDPAQLVHGDPGAIRSSAGTLRTFSGAFGETARGLQGTDSAHWTGAAADAFRARFAPHPARWQDASSATSTAAGALESYAGAVESAQGQARQAIAVYEQGQQATAQAQASYNAQVAAYNRAAQAYNATLAERGRPRDRLPPSLRRSTTPGRPCGSKPPSCWGTPGTRGTPPRPRRRTRSGRPPTWPRPNPRWRPGWASDVMDGLQVANLADISFAGGIADGTADLVQFARTLDPLDQWNLDHPAEYVAGLSGTAAGLAEVGTDPPKLARGCSGAGRHRVGQRPVPRRRTAGPERGAGRGDGRRRYRGRRGRCRRAGRAGVRRGCGCGGSGRAGRQPGRRGTAAGRHSDRR